MDACDYEVIFLETAARQLSGFATDYFDYLGSKEQLDKIMESLEKNIESLSTFPERYPMISRKIWGDREIRRMPLEFFCVYYLVSKEHRLVLISAVIPSKFDQIRQLRQQFN